jgi:hypothetical protein
VVFVVRYLVVGVGFRWQATASYLPSTPYRDSAASISIHYPACSVVTVTPHTVVIDDRSEEINLTIERAARSATAVRNLVSTWPPLRLARLRCVRNGIE